MPLSFRSRLAKLEHKRQITTEEHGQLLKKLDGHDRQIRIDAIDEYYDKMIEGIRELMIQYESDKQNVPKPDMTSFIALLTVVSEKLKE